MIGSRIRLRRSLRINNGLKVINGVLDVRINFTMQQSPTFEARASWCRDRDPLDYRLINVPRTLRTSLAQLRPNRHTRYRTLVPILTPRTHWTQVSTDRSTTVAKRRRGFDWRNHSTAREVVIERRVRKSVLRSGTTSFPTEYRQILQI